jgi:general secretion pathway protein J
MRGRRTTKCDRPPHEAGLTLIEVLIAVSLVSLLSTGMLMAIRTGLTALEKTNARLMANRKSVGAQRILEQQIAGFMPLAADCVAAPGAPAQRIPFFQGEPQSMRFVSSYSLEEAHRGAPRVVEFQVIPGADNRGARLVVNEHLYAGPRGAGLFCLGRALDPIYGMAPRFPPIQIGPRSFVLADRLAGCRFWFRQSLPAPLPERWLERWALPEWPTAIRVEMVPLEQDRSRIPLLPLTVPLRAQKDPAVQYVN